MAKALLGHVPQVNRSAARLAAENRVLRQRIADLERVVLRLQADNDALTADRFADATASMERQELVTSSA